MTPNPENNISPDIKNLQNLFLSIIFLISAHIVPGLSVQAAQLPPNTPLIEANETTTTPQDWLEEFINIDNLAKEIENASGLKIQKIQLNFDSRKIDEVDYSIPVTLQLAITLEPNQENITNKIQTLVNSTINLTVKTGDLKTQQVVTFLQLTFTENKLTGGIQIIEVRE